MSASVEETGKPHFVRAAIQAHQARLKREEEDRQHEERVRAMPALAMADCITSGLSGNALSKALQHHCQTALKIDPLSASEIDPSVGCPGLAARRVAIS